MDSLAMEAGCGGTIGPVACNTMRRRLFTILSALSLALSMGTIALWAGAAVSYHPSSLLMMSYSGAGTLCQINSTRAGLHLVVSEGGGRSGFAFKRRYAVGNYADDLSVRGLGFVFAHLDTTIYGGDYIYRPFVAIVLPYWFLVLMALIIPCWQWRGILVRRRHVQRDLCPNCGYDLRATPARCPECGRRTGTRAELGGRA